MNNYNNNDFRLYGDNYEVERSGYKARHSEKNVNRSAGKKKSHVGLWFSAVAMSAAIAATAGTTAFLVMNNNGSTAQALNPSAVVVQNQAPNAAPDAENTLEINRAETVHELPEGAQQNEAGAASAAMAVAQTAYSGHSLSTTAEPNIIQVDGERVYMDTKHLAPQFTGTPAHFLANGKTSYGFDWNYSADNSNFVIACNYNFARQQYDFAFYGTRPGIANVTLYYNTADDVQVPVQLTLQVDANLNTAQI